MFGGWLAASIVSLRCLKERHHVGVQEEDNGKIKAAKYWSLSQESDKTLLLLLLQ